MIVKHLPRESALMRELDGADHAWGLPEQLLAAIADALHGANWQRGQGKRADRPRPIPRPGVEQEKTYVTEAVSIDEMKHWLGWERQLTED